jgi:hypothetical protein
MAFQPVPGVVQVQMTFTKPSTGQFAGMNVLNFRRSDYLQPTAADMNTLLDNLLDWHYGWYRPIHSAGVSLTRIQARGLDHSESFFVDRNVSVAGVQVGEGLSSKMTFCVSFRSIFSGRSTRGRVYMCGLVESQVAGDVVTTAYGNAAREAWEYMPGELTGALNEHVIVSRYTGGVKRVSGVAFPVAAYTITDYVIDTQRDRVK